MTGQDDPDRRAREDEEWRSIVDNYGEHPEFVAPDRHPEPDPEPQPDPAPAYDVPPELSGRDWHLEDEEHFVPPPAPPVPRPHGLRLAAWFGLFGVPTVALFCVVFKVSLPSPLGFLGLLCFVAGFGYLVATMNGPKDPDGGWDDGAVV